MEKKWHFTYKRMNNLNDCRFLIGNHSGQKERAYPFSSAKRTINPESYIQWNILQEQK